MERDGARGLRLARKNTFEVFYGNVARKKAWYLLRAPACRMKMAYCSFAFAAQQLVIMHANNSSTDRSDGVKLTLQTLSLLRKLHVS
jgi:hypothetical protein